MCRRRHARPTTTAPSAEPPDRPRVPSEDAATDHVRLDVWLDVACLFKTRSEAQRACLGGMVDVNDQRAKAHRTLQCGDRVSITRPSRLTQRVVVRSLATRHVPKATARTLYGDVTPPPTPAELELRRLVGAPGGQRRWRPGRTSADAAPDKRQRRELRRLKGR